MSKSNKKDVGKGIRALLSNMDKSDSSVKKEVIGIGQKDLESNQLALKYIEPNPFQPRHEFDQEELDELTSSIKTHGIIQPLAVRKLNSKSYQIISGERRWRAARNLKLEKVPVHILEADDQAMLEIALLENIQRADLNAIEIAISFQQLITDCHLTHEELSERIGKKRSSISNYLRLLKLSPAVQDALKKNQISLGHAKLLAGLEHVENQTNFLGIIIRDDLSVRATENLLKSKKSSRPGLKTQNTSNPQVIDITKKLTEHLGSKVKIDRNTSGKGSIKISFSSDDEFNDIIETMLEN